MKAYRYITGPDDKEFCYRITGLLNNGWQLVGLTSLTLDSAKKRVICGQTVVKDAPDTEFSSFSSAVDLSKI